MLRIGLVGLGKMGLNMALNLQRNSFGVQGFDVSQEAREEAGRNGLSVHESMEGLLESLDEQKIVLVSTPAGKITNAVVSQLVGLLRQGDILVDTGNSFYKESVKNYFLAKEKGIDFLDCGTSGGMEGALNGACLMIGGDREAFDQVEEVFASLAIEKGYIYAGKAGSGHYLKMVHNGIEYGMMQAIGEGFDILHASEYEYDLEEVASVWNHGSVIRSWLMELAEESFKQDAKLDRIRGIIDSSGEGKWTVEEALELNIPVPVIASSLFVRSASKIEDSFSAKVVASLRNQFGGHDVVEN